MNSAGASATVYMDRQLTCETGWTDDQLRRLKLDLTLETR